MVFLLLLHNEFRVVSWKYRLQGLNAVSKLLIKQQIRYCPRTKKNNKKHTKKNYEYAQFFKSHMKTQKIKEYFRN